jgi:hypothetical protein
MTMLDSPSIAPDADPAEKDLITLRKEEVKCRNFAEQQLVALLDVREAYNECRKNIEKLQDELSSLAAKEKQLLLQWEQACAKVSEIASIVQYRVRGNVIRDGRSRRNTATDQAVRILQEMGPMSCAALREELLKRNAEVKATSLHVTLSKRHDLFERVGYMLWRAVVTAPPVVSESVVEG